MATLTNLGLEVLSHQFAPSQYEPYAREKINQAQAYICAQTDFRELQSTSVITLIPGQSSYSLPSDFQRNDSVLATDDEGRLIPLQSSQRYPFDALPVADGTPETYEIKGSTLKLWPTPDSARNVIFNYYAKPPTLEPADSPIIPDQYEYLLVHYALKFCFERENDYTSAGYHWQMFEAGLMKCRGEVQHDTNDRSQPRIVGDDSSPSLLVEGF